MYLRKSEAEELTREHFKSLFSRLHGHNDFLGELTNVDDWSFVIKTQALIEDSLTRAILAQMGDERMKATVEVMPLVGDQVSKLSLAKDLNLLDARQRRFVKRLAALRNKLAHRVDNADFKFDSYLAGLNEAALRDWTESIVWYPGEPTTLQTCSQIARTRPRVAIHIAAFMITALLAVDAVQKEIARKIDLTAIATTTELLRLLDPEIDK